MEQPTYEQLKARVAELEAERAKARAEKGISFKVSTKGAISVYGLGRNPVSLYSGQMRKLLAHSKEIEKFIVDNWDKGLSHKDGEQKELPQAA